MKRKYFKKFLQFFFFNFFFCYLRMIPAVPKRQAAVKSHRNNRSSTIAMNFQSSITCKIIQILKLDLVWCEDGFLFCWVEYRLTLWKGWENVVNYDHSQYWPMEFVPLSSKALTKYEQLKMKRDAREKWTLCQASLFIFGCSYFLRALVERGTNSIGHYCEWP